MGKIETYNTSIAESGSSGAGQSIHFNTRNTDDVYSGAGIAKLYEDMSILFFGEVKCPQYIVFKRIIFVDFSCCFRVCFFTFGHGVVLVLINLRYCFAFLAPFYCFAINSGINT